jgi:hypothetical protein
MLKVYDGGSHGLAWVAPFKDEFNSDLLDFIRACACHRSFTEPNDGSPGRRLRVPCRRPSVSYRGPVPN